LPDVDPKLLKCKECILPAVEVNSKRKTFIFDLDETLIHCETNLSKQHDFAVTMNFPNGKTVQAGIKVRPGAMETIRKLKPFAEIIVFTASHNCYMAPILDKLDPNKELFDHYFCRRNCIIIKPNL